MELEVWSDMATTVPLEILRQHYKPDNIRVLFVGESPPANGTFFYTADSNLFRYTRLAFSAAFDTTFETPESFLRFFQGHGCYLEDLSVVPVNHLDSVERRKSRMQSVKCLARRMHTAMPRAVVVVMREIEPHVKRAAQQAGLGAVPIYAVSFPAFGNQQRYISEIANILRSLRKNGIVS